MEIPNSIKSPIKKTPSQYERVKVGEIRLPYTRMQYACMIVIFVSNIVMPFMLIEGAQKIQTISYTSIEDCELIYQPTGMDSIAWDKYTGHYQGYGTEGRTNVDGYGNFTTIHDGNDFMTTHTWTPTPDGYVMFQAVFNYNVREALNDGIMYVVPYFWTDATKEDGNPNSYAAIGFVENIRNVWPIPEKVHTTKTIDHESYVLSDGINDFANLTNKSWSLNVLDIIELNNVVPTATLYIHWRHDVLNTGFQFYWDIAVYGTTTSLIPLRTTVYDKSVAMTIMWSFTSLFAFLYVTNLMNFRRFVKGFRYWATRKQKERKNTKFVFSTISRKSLKLKRWRKDE